MRKSAVIIFFFLGFHNHASAQNFNVILGRPTDTSITLSVMFDQNMQVSIEYDTSTLTLNNNTEEYEVSANIPNEIDLKNLLPDERYYYRLKYGVPGGSTFSYSPQYNFHTQRRPGKSFVFTVEADEHLYDIKGVGNMFKVTLANQALDTPDFMLSLGDIFGDDHYPDVITSSELDYLHKYYRPFLGAVCHSIPFYIALGNHEGENDYYFNQNPPNNLCIWATKWRKFYYPNPSPNAFYSGNTDIEPYEIGSPENYYSWKWGDALFVVLDVYRDENDTTPKPQSWDWTLGMKQYTWLKNTLETSNAKYKFVFAHHLSGQGRGGIVPARLFEWGGYDRDGSTYTFPFNRPFMEKPIHKLFVDNGVNIFFQGHDHLYAKEVLDGVTYQEVPMGADSTYTIGVSANSRYYTSNVYAGTGHVRVMVTPDGVKVDFVRAYLPADVNSSRKNREIPYSYCLGDCSKIITEGELPPSTQELQINPNPANDVIILQFSHAVNNLQTEMFNSLGQIVYRGQSGIIDVAKFVSGIYYLKVIADGALTTKRILIQH